MTKPVVGLPYTAAQITTARRGRNYDRPPGGVRMVGFRLAYDPAIRINRGSIWIMGVPAASEGDSGILRPSLKNLLVGFRLVREGT